MINLHYQEVYFNWQIKKLVKTAMNELSLMLNDFETFYVERGSPSIRKYHKRKRKRFSFGLRG